MTGEENQNDESIWNSGALVQLKLGDEERRALRWLFPLLIALGFSLALDVFMIYFWHNADNDALLVYAHQVRCEADWEAHGFNAYDHCMKLVHKGD